MQTIVLNIPVETKYSERELKEFFAARLFEEGIISSGTGAKILGIDRRDFISLLSKYNVCYLDYELSDYEKKLIADASRT